MPPYSWDWSSKGYLDYGPGTLSAYANRETGMLGFADIPDPHSDLEIVSYAAAAVGIYFRPKVAGVVAVTTTAPITDQFYYVAVTPGVMFEAGSDSWCRLTTPAIRS
jgi:hypothetical protein